MTLLLKLLEKKLTRTFNEIFFRNLLQEIISSGEEHFSPWMAVSLTPHVNDTCAFSKWQHYVRKVVNLVVVVLLCPRDINIKSLQ